MTLQQSSVKCHGGEVRTYKHTSKLLNCDMEFSAFVPEGKVIGTMYFLSGLTCNHQNFITKACAIKKAAELGIVLICPDTSPRGLNIEGEDDSWDFGSGAGFYVDATETKWKSYQMYSYITKELPAFVQSELGTDPNKVSIFGHSMGGHGALVCALKNPGMYKSCSAFAPISNPVNCPWGEKAFSGYLGGQDKSKWEEYDSSILLKKYKGQKLDILVDQGLEDGFYKQKQLLVESLKDHSNDLINLDLRMHEGYDHSYYFIQTFIEEHLTFHAKRLL